MNIEKMKADYSKTRDVIMSCNNWEQLKVGVKMFNQLDNLHSLPEKELRKLENLIGLMRIKCKNTSSYDVIEKVDEDTSNIGKEFRKYAGMSGEPELQKIKFSEEEKFKGGKADNMTPEDLAKKHDVEVNDIKKEISVGTKIEMEHTDSKTEAKEIAMDHITEFPDYYTNNNFGIVAIEKARGEGRKTIRISKNDMEKLHKDGKLDLEGISLSYPEDMDEATSAGSSGSYEGLFSGGKQQPVRRTFDDIPTTKNGIVGKRQTGLPIGKMYSFNEDKEVLEEEITTGNDIIDTLLGIFIASRIAGAKPKEVPQYIAEVGGDLMIGFIKFMSRFGYSVDTDVLKTKWDGLLKKALRKYYKEGGVLYPMLDDAEKNTKKRKKDNYEEEELDEATTVGGVGGVYDTPGFPASKFMGTAGKKGKAPVKKKQPNDVLKNLGYQKVRVKEKCKKFPYCNQSPEAIEFYNESRIIKTIKKGNLKIK